MINNNYQWLGAGEQDSILFRPVYLFIFFIISASVAAIFFIFPQIDLSVSKLFYISGPRFYLAENIILISIRHVVESLVIGFMIFWPCLLMVNFIKKRPVLGLTKIRIIYLILALAIGPGLVVNTIFKDMWGRARPSQIITFGGNKKFTPAFVISDQCKVNCSFVSGDPSVGFYLFALAMAIPSRRKLFMISGLGLGFVFGATRIIQGGHFLSDVIFSGVFTFTAAYLLYCGLLKIERSLRGGGG